MSDFKLDWRAPGPVADAFMRDRSDVACIIGPVGSGKTSAALVKMVMTAFTMRPCNDGVRRAKFLVVRDTYPNLDATTIKTWHMWVHRERGRYVDSSPRTHDVAFEVGGQRIEIGVEFRALGEHTAEDTLRGWEGTALYLNEADLLPPDILTHAIGRVGRYPSAAMGGCSWSGIWMDCNAPDVDNWIYATFVDNPEPGYRLFLQPGGRDPAAENLHNLKEGYYERQIKLNAKRGEWWIRRFVDNLFGASREGKPVYPEYNDLRHCASAPLAAIAGRKLIIGVDAGATPAATIWQPAIDGQWRALDEIVVAEDATMGPTMFGEEINRILAEKFPGFTPDMITGWGDPAADKDRSRDEFWLDTLRHVTGIRFRAAPTNALQPRLEAVRSKLTRSGENGKPMLLISPSCRVLRKGFNSHYHYRRVQIGQGRFADEPDKNHWSHVHDSAQYALIGGGEHMAVRGRNLVRAQTQQPVIAATDWNAHA